MMTKMHRKIVEAQTPPLPDTELKKCGECHKLLPQSDFKPTTWTADGCSKRCKKCITAKRLKDRDDTIAKTRQRNIAALQQTMKTKVAGCPLESELLARVTMRMGGLDVVAKLIADDWQATPPSTAQARAWQSIYFASCKRNEERTNSKTDIRNMTEDQVREELNKKIRETIAAGLDSDGILKITKSA